jgi:hypothetical protein
MISIDEHPYSFTVQQDLSDDVMIFTIVSSRSAKVMELVKNKVTTAKRNLELFKLDDDTLIIEDDVNDIESHSAASRLVSWQGIEDELTHEAAYYLCKNYPEIRKQIIYHSDLLAEHLDKCVEKLIEFAKNELFLSEKQKDGSSLREHLLNIQKQYNVTPPELVEIEVSYLVMYLWESFLELNSTRQSGMGVNAISYSEIKAYCELTQTRFSPYEIKVIKMLDRAFLEHYNKPTPESSK